jgi:hypothetical protein
MPGRVAATRGVGMVPAPHVEPGQAEVQVAVGVVVLPFL